MSIHFKLISLFDHLPGVLFFAKDTGGRVVGCNKAFMERFGFTGKEEVIGKTDHDLFSAELADQYVKDDKEIMESKTPKFDLIELVPNEDGVPDWVITNKIPLLDPEGNVVGVSGTAQSMRNHQLLASLIPDNTDK